MNCGLAVQESLLQSHPDPIQNLLLLLINTSKYPLFSDEPKNKDMALYM